MYTVLIVEDEMLIRVGLKNLINWSGLGMTIVGEAQDGNQGLELYHRKKPDVILTDIKMSGMDGIEMIRQIRQQDTRTRIVVLSSYEDFSLVRDAFVLGISDYILKLKMMPEEMERVMCKVCDELKQDRAQAEIDNAGRRQEEEEARARVKAKSYIVDGACTPEEFRGLAERLRISEQELCVSVLEILPSAQKQRTTDRQHTGRIGQIVLNLIQTLLLEYGEGEVWQEKETRYLIVQSFPKAESIREKRELCEAVIERIRTAVQSCVNRKPVCGVSGFADSYQELNRLYTEALWALETALLQEEPWGFYGDRQSGEKEAEPVRREVAEALVYIQLHYADEDLSLPKVAREVAIHKDYLSKLFKKETGIGFSDYINLHRIKKARELLETTSMRSYEIARRVGFQDETYFCRVFKKIMGMGANEYRRKEKDKPFSE